MSRFLIRLADWFVRITARISPWLGRGRIPEVTTEELRRLIDHAPQSSDMILVDVRTPEESAVSMIPSAITVEQFEAEKTAYAHKKIVVYCTIGGRSFIYAQKIATQGFQACNYRPSIIGWCEAGLPLIDQMGQQTKRVHTYSKKFSVPKPYESTSFDEN